VSQTYYALTHDAFCQASTAMWAADDANERSRTRIQIMFVGLDGWMWCTNPARHALLAECMDRLHIPYQVTTERATHPFVEPFL
jgi:hypothetical protein